VTQTGTEFNLGRK